MNASSTVAESVPPLCAITVDVESDWGGRASVNDRGLEGCVYSIPRLLEIFDRFGVPATFFVSSEVTGVIASELRAITSRGHEIASHGWRHVRYDHLPLTHFETELERSKKTLEDVTGTAVAGFRSPQFAVHQDLFPALARAGYQYDSSLVAGRFPTRYHNKIDHRPFWKDGVLEVPVGRLPFTPFPSGLLWLNLARAALPLDWFADRHRQVVVFYLHPFDLYPAKYTARYNWKVNLWYLLRKKHVSGTLESYIQRVTERSRFVKMRDLLLCDWNAS
jgi:peptidoglycan/xylan/chitin deacetylase (PgdA/CDA1 family)